VLQHGARLVKGNAREQFDKLADWHTVFKILEEGSNGHARAAEHPRSTDPLGVTFNRWTA
jgi:hypothetical protein